MPITERDPELTLRDRRISEGMSRWAGSHLNDFIGRLDFDPANPDQWVERAVLNANPDLAMARQFGAAGMSPESYGRLVADFKRIGAVELVRQNATANKQASTLFATLHLKDALDTAITHNGLFAASEDPRFADMNVVLANYIMSVMTVGGVAVDRVLTLSGIEIRALPADALSYIDRQDFEFINQIALPALNKALKQGVAIHQAPSGTRAKPAEVIADGTPALSVSRVSDSTAYTIVNKSPTAIGIPMQVKVGSSTAVVMEPRRLKSEKEVHDLMHEMVEEVNLFSDQLVVYGLPNAIRLKKPELPRFDATAATTL